MQSKSYSQSPYRFVVLVTYLTTSLVNCLPMQTFSSINVAVENIFKISATEVTLNALLFNVAHPLFGFPCNWLINRFGMHKCYILGGAFVISGVWLRLLIEESRSTYVLIGSALVAIGNIFIVNTPSKVATNWFASKWVNLVAFIGVCFTTLSITIGAALPGFFINDTHSTAEDVKKLLFIEAIVVTVPYAFLMIFFRDHPQHPPSRAANKIVNQKRENYRSLLKKLFKNKEYIKLMAVTALNNGTLNATIAIFDQAIKGFGYENSSSVTSDTILSATIVGVISNIIFSMLLRKSNAYRLMVGVGTFGALMMFVVSVVAFMYLVTKTVYLLILGGLFGFFMMPLLSMFIMYASQIAFPIDEASTAGYLLLSAQTFGFAAGFAAINFLNKTKLRSEIVMFTLCGFLFLSFVLSMFVKQDLKKLEYEIAISEIREKSHLSQTLIVHDSANNFKK